MKESKSFPRFKKQASEFDKLIEGKPDEDIERLVSKKSFHGDNLFYFLVLENLEAQCSTLRSRCDRLAL